MPADLQAYDGLRLYCKVRGEIKGRVTIWNPYKPLWKQKDFLYPADFGSWLMLSQAFFNSTLAPNQSLIKGLLCAMAEIQAENLDKAFIAQPLILPSLTASIVLPTKDRPKELAQALERLVKHQTGVLHEIIVVDNHPASRLTKPVVEQFAGVRYIEESRPGTGYARNAGILATRGDIMVTTDDDIRVGEGWLDNLIAPFADPEIASAMGLVLPYQLNNSAQFIFEELKRADRFRYEERRFGRAFFEQADFPEMGKCGNTSCAAFRIEVFADPQIGPFEVALGAGTPAHGSEDIYLFYRLLAAGKTHLYQPKARAYHVHRATMSSLRRQLSGHETGYVAMLLLARLRHQDRRVNLTMAINLFRYQLRQARLKLSGNSNKIVPARLSLARIWGMLSGPYQLWRSLALPRKYGTYQAAQVAKYLAHRQTISGYTEAELQKVLL